MSTCLECGNAPVAPNYLSTYQDDDGDPYNICQMCEDFEADYARARTQKRRDALATRLYAEWRRRWPSRRKEGKA